MGYKEQFQFWLEDSYFYEATKQELLAIRNDEKEIEDRFYKDLAFGTGGLRGVIGAGTNRMNIYTVRKATQGLANYIKKQGGEKKGVAIAYDSRRMSPEFADEAALCLAANGIKAYVFDALRPTPELSFALRTLGCISGIVITASHNPPEYNGYKCYWEDGAQVTAPKDKEIITEVNNVTDYHTVKTMDKEEAKKAGLYVVIGKEIDDKYMAELKKQIIHPEVIAEMAEDMKAALDRAQAEEYAAHGLVKRSGAYYYKDQPVRIFMDQRQDDQSFRTLDVNPRGAVDVEVVRPRRPGLPAYVLSEVEREEFDGSWEDFYRLWTRKESWCKREDAPLFPPRQVETPPPCPHGSWAGGDWRGAVCCHGAPPEEVVWLEAGELPGLRDS